MSKIIKVREHYDYIEKHPNFTGCLENRFKTIVWFKNGEYHREDGPAVEYADGDKWWYLNNLRYYKEQDYKIAVRIIKLERVLKQID